MNENVIEIRNLKKSFKTNHVLKGVNLSIKKGSIFALLGSNGAGKTTVVKIMSTLSKPDDGEVYINEFDVQHEGKQVRDIISLTGQFVAVDDSLTGRENLKLIGQLLRIKNLKAKINEWLSFFKLEDAADRKVSTYSGGMRRRLDIALSLMSNPQVLFLDEPTTGMDPQSRNAMWDLVKDLSQKGTTVFLTTQYLEEAENLADHIAILHEGTILAEGTAQYLKSIMPQRGAQLNFQDETMANEAMILLKEKGIEVEGMEQNLPSLEDVFLTLIDEKAGGKNNE